MTDDHTVYNVNRDYEWNYHHVPCAEVHGNPDIAPIPGNWTYAGLPVASPLAMSAGPLLNSRWIAYYAKLGFDVLTYKTVRRCKRDSYPTPNLVPVATGELKQAHTEIECSGHMDHSWAVSFGMPSREPVVWQEDVTRARESLRSGQLLCVSVVATPEPSDNLHDIAEDYASCAKGAFASGADVVEVNFSCPNVATRDGMLYAQPEASLEILKRVRDSIQDRPLLVKLGYISNPELARHWVELAEGWAQALVMVNCIGTKVKTREGDPLFDGEPRGIAGQAICSAVKDQVRLFRSIIKERTSSLRIIAVGGISSLQDVHDHLETGAEAVQIATAAMLDPLWAIRVRREWNQP